MTTHEIMLSHGEKNDITAYPYWAIVKKAGLGRQAILAGIWFNREDAERYLEAKRYNFGKTAFVYCFSGHESWHLKEMYENARTEQKEKAS